MHVNNRDYSMCTLSIASVKRKLISCAVSSTGLCIKPSVCKCFGVDTDSEIASPNASWNAEKTTIRGREKKRILWNCPDKK